jgi:aspartate/methionine/tyrosine aminotransferase
MFSSRSSVDLSPNPLAVALERARASSREVVDLTESNPTRAGLPYAREAILAALARPAALAYEPAAFGIAPAREAVAKELSALGPATDPSRVVLTASTSEAYAFLFKLLCDPGDEVLVPVPSYPLFEHLARLESVRAVPYRLAYDGAWHIDLASARDAVTPRTRAVVTVTPNNPTGSYLKRAELAGLAALGLPIVSDEVFAGYPLRDDPTRARSVLEAEGAELVFALGGLSKLAALPQMKLAWTTVGGRDARVAEAMGRLEVIADAFLSLATPVQHGAGALLASRHVVEDAIRARTRANLAFAQDAVRGSPVTLLDVEGGWYATLRVPATRSELEWTVALVEGDGIHVHPGHFFDFDREAYLVVSLLTPEAAFRDALPRLVHRVTTTA